MAITLRYGPYVWNGILRHRTERLYGLIGRLEELKYKVVLKPHYIWDDLEITMHDVKVFKCRITFFKYNCRWELDPVCKRALKAIQQTESRIMEALAPRQHVVESSKVEVPPVQHLLYELVWSLPLPLTPAEEVLSVFIRTVLDVECVRDILYSVLDRAIDLATVAEYVKKIYPQVLPSSASSQPTSSGWTSSPTSVSEESSRTPTPSPSDVDLREIMQEQVDKSLDGLPTSYHLRETLSKVMTEILVHATSKKTRNIHDQLTASKLMLSHFEENFYTLHRVRIQAEDTSHMIITSLTGNLPIKHEAISEEALPEISQSQ